MLDLILASLQRVEMKLDMLYDAVYRVIDQNHVLVAQVEANTAADTAVLDIISPRQPVSFRVSLSPLKPARPVKFRISLKPIVRPVKFRVSLKENNGSSHSRFHSF